MKGKRKGGSIRSMFRISRGKGRMMICMIGRRKGGGGCNRSGRRFGGLRILRSLCIVGVNGVV